MSGLKLKLHEFHGKLAFVAKLKLYLRSDHVGESGLKFIASLEFPGGPVIGTPCFHCGGLGFSPWSGN